MYYKDYIWGNVYFICCKWLLQSRYWTEELIHGGIFFISSHFIHEATIRLILPSSIYCSQCLGTTESTKMRHYLIACVLAWRQLKTPLCNTLKAGHRSKDRRKMNKGWGRTAGCVGPVWGRRRKGESLLFYIECLVKASLNRWCSGLHMAQR